MCLSLKSFNSLKINNACFNILLSNAMTLRFYVWLKCPNTFEAIVYLEQTKSIASLVIAAFPL